MVGDAATLMIVGTHNFPIGSKLSNLHMRCQMSGWLLQGQQG